MIVIPLVQYAAAAVTATLAISSGRNMFQTWRIANRSCASSSFSSCAVGDEGNYNFIDTTTSTTSIYSEHEQRVLEKLKRSSGSFDRLLGEIENLTRKEIIVLHQSTLCRSPNEVEIEGEWDGILLNNNGLVMTSVTSFLTNRLFGRGRIWNGKVFFRDLTGMNRFKPNKMNGDDTSTVGDAEMQHAFQYTIRPSRLSGRRSRNARPIDVISLNYTVSQGLLSLWRTMVDEIRILDVESLVLSNEDGNTTQNEDSTANKKCSYRILIGLGCMAWSGGILNASPFVLYRT